MDDQIESLLTRGVDTVYPTKEVVEKVLRSGKKLKIYQGFDPTGPQLHIGHMVGLRKLRQWQELGHHVIFLIGDFTATIGDPTGKYSQRKVMSKEEVLENAKHYKEQAGRVLKFTGPNPVQVLFNSEWLAPMSAMEFLRLSGLLTIAQVVERDMFQKRLKQGQDIFMNEFLYPVMQAYDSVHMDVDMEIGGTDQVFNMLMGRKLMKRIKDKEKFVMTTPLLTDAQGTKIGKTEGNVIGLTDKPADLYGKIMTLSDDVITKAFEYLTDIGMEEVQSIEKELQNGANPLQYKKRLAFEIVKQLNSEDDATSAQEEFESVHQEKEAVPTDIPEVYVNDKTIDVATVLIEAKMADSRGEVKRLLAQGAIEVDGTVLKEPTLTLENKTVILKIGKHRFLKISM